MLARVRTPMNKGINAGGKGKDRVVDRNRHEDGGRRVLQIRWGPGPRVGSAATGIQPCPSKPGSPHRVGELPTRRAFGGSQMSLPLWTTPPLALRGLLQCQSLPLPRGEDAQNSPGHGLPTDGSAPGPLPHSCVTYPRRRPPFRAQGGDCISRARTVICTK